jgi:hypothetical protein
MGCVAVDTHQRQTCNDEKRNVMHSERFQLIFSRIYSRVWFL